MGQITTDAASVFRDMESPGSTTPHEPVKADIRTLFATIDGEIEDFADIVLSGRLEFETWVALAAVVGTQGLAGAVNPADTGTHTDPVVGGTVANSGIYRYSTSPAGWKRIGAYQAVSVATLAEVNTGTDTAKAVTPSTLKNTTWANRERVTCAVSGTPTATSVTLRPLNPQVRFTGTGAQYIYEFEMPVTKGAGSYNVTLEQYDGTTFVAAFPLRDWLNQALPTGTPQAGDWVEFTRDLDGATFWKILHRSDTVTEPLAKVLSAIIATGENPSPIRPLHARKVNPNEWFVDIMPHEDHYVSAAAEANKARSDRLRWILFNLGDATADPGGLPMLTSVFSRYSFVNQDITNQRFTDIVGADADTGHVPSVFEPVIILGDFSLAANSTNFQLAGQAHGHVSDTAWDLTGVRAGVSFPGLQDDQLLTEFYGDTLICTSTGFLDSPTAQRLGAYEYLTTYAQASGYQVRVQTTFDFSISGQDAVPGTRQGGYAAMMPLMDCNRIVTWVGGVRQAIQTIDLRDGSTILLGNAEKAVAWHTANPTVQIVWENGAPVGNTHWSNGVPVAIAQESFVINNTWGSKFYVPIYPTTGKDSLDGQVLTFDSTYKVVVDDAIV